MSNIKNLLISLMEDDDRELVNNKWATVTLGEHSLRKIAALGLEPEDQQQVLQALEVFRLERSAESVGKENV